MPVVDVAALIHLKYILKNFHAALLNSFILFYTNELR